MSEAHGRWLSEVAHRVGPPPRGMFSALRRHGASKPPPWLSADDLISRIFLNRTRILRDGQVRWAAIVHANSRLFQPGPVDSGAQVVYSPDESVPLPAVQAIAHATYALKGTRPLDPPVRRIADMLTDELERALDWPIPTSLTGGAKAVTTVVILPRAFMPSGFIGLSFFPILADPKTSMAMLIPSRFWPAEMIAAWNEASRPVIDRLPLVALTARAAAEVRRATEGRRTVAELRCRPEGKFVRYTFKLVPAGQACAAHRMFDGARVEIRDAYTLARAAGTTVDHTGRAFVVTPPGAAGKS